MMKSLIWLQRVEDKFNIESFIHYYHEERGAFTPKQLLLLLNRMNDYKVQHNADDFKLTIRRDRDKRQFAEFNGYEVEQLWPCMTATQREWYDRRFPGQREKHAVGQRRVEELMAQAMATVRSKHRG